MLKRDISFRDWDDKPTTETHYFNLNMTELMEIDLEEILKTLSKKQDPATVAKELRKVIMASVGERDGKYFVKDDDVQKRFERTGAYNALIMELANNADSAGDFIKALLPSEMAAQLDEALKEEAARMAQAQLATAATTDTSSPTT